jgi:hypothetical protein
MNTTELIAYARNTATIEDNSSEFTDAVITQLLNMAMATYFEPIVETVRSGYWLHSLTRTLGTGNPYVRLHPRHCALEQVDIRLTGGDWVPLSVAIESEAQDWDPRAAYPQAYSVRGTTLTLLPAPTTSNLELRAKVTIRPSQLVTEQTAGRVVAVDTTARTLTVNAIPVDRVTGSSMATTTVIDVVEPRGFYELSLFDAPATVTDSSTITVGAGPSLARIEVGDYVRVANQTDWPQLPQSYHTVLGAAAAVPICLRRDMYDRANEIAASTGAAAQRMSAQLSPRPRAQNHTPVQHGWR